MISSISGFLPANEMLQQAGMSVCDRHAITMSGNFHTLIRHNFTVLNFAENLARLYLGFSSSPPI